SVVRTAYGAFDTDPIPGQTIIPRNYGLGPAQFTVNLRVSKTINIGHRGPAASARAEGFQGGGDLGRGGRGRGGLGGGGRGAGSENGLYSITLSVDARNLFNHVNLAQPIGNLSSSRFGESIALRNSRGASQSANRMLYLQMRIAF